MSDGAAIHRAASVLRTAFGGRAMTRFDAPLLVGPVPQAGRTIEHVERRGRHVEIEWDNGMVLDTNLRLSGEWHVYRQGEKWRSPYEKMSVSLENEGWVAVCFNAADVETYRRPDKRRHPGMGRLGPDLSRSHADLGHAVNLLLSYVDAAAPVGKVLLDQRVMFGVGNVCRSESLWLTGLSPFAPVGDLTEADAVRLVNTLASQMRASLHPGRRPGAGPGRSAPSVYGRIGQMCHRCPGSIRSCRMGVNRRELFWCPSCQSHLDPGPGRADDTPVMDPHPAAQDFVRDLPWNRHHAS